MSRDAILGRVIPDVEFHQNRYARLLAQVVQPGAMWLDIGAGHRLHSGWKHDRPEDIAGRATILVGCDLVSEHLKEHRLLTAGVLADAVALPFRNGSFDLVTANMVLEHLRDPQSTFGEVARVLRPEGEFIFLTPNLRHPAVWLASRLLPSRWRSALSHAVEHRAERDIFPTHYRANTKSRIARLAAGAGLNASVLEVFPSYPFTKGPAPLVLIEAYWIRLAQHSPLRSLSSNIVGRLAKREGAPDQRI